MKFWFNNGGWISNKAHQQITALTRDNVKFITVIRHAALGDMVLTRPFLIELRKAFKNSFITLSICSNYTRGVPEDLVDKVHIVHGTDQRDVPYGTRKKRFKELGHQDIIFDLAATNRSFRTCFHNSAKLKVGFPYRWIRARMFYDFTVHRSDLSYEVDNMLSMLHAIGVKTSHPHKFNMPGEKLARDKPYIIYFTGASIKQKCWPLESFSGLINRMSAEYPKYDHLILGGIQDWEKSETVLDHTNDANNINSIEADNINDTVSLLKGADLVVANDTGIRNLAIACETPTVGIFTITVPFRYWPRTTNHDIVLSDNEHVPSVKNVFNTCASVLSLTGTQH